MGTLAEYLDYYGFKSEPFVGKGCFYASKERKEVLDQVEHWCDFGAGIIVVEGVEGVGKSALLPEVISRCDDNALISHLDGPVLAGLDQMLMLLAAELGAELIEGQTSGAMLGYLRKHVNSASQSMYVVVDQAHKLDDRTLLALLSLLQGQQPGESKLNIIAFSQPGLAERLRGFEVADVIVNDILLVPFDSSSSSSYVHQQLVDVEYDGPELFSQMELSELYKASGGLPGKLNLLAQNLLINRLYNKSAKTKGFPVWHLVGVGALLAVLGTAYVYRGDIPALLKPEQSSSIEQASPKGKAPAVETTLEQTPGSVNDSVSVSFDGAGEGSQSQASGGSSQTINTIADAENIINEALTPSEPTLENGELALNDAGAANEFNRDTSQLVDATAEAASTQDESAESNGDLLTSDEGAIADDQGVATSQDATASQHATASQDETSPQAITDADEALAVEGVPRSDQAGSSQEGLNQEGLNQEELNQEGLESIELSDVNEIGDGTIDYSSLSGEQIARLGMDPAFDLSVFTEDEQYLLRLPDSAYVLQLIAVRTTEQVEKFLRVQSNREQLRIFNRERDGKSWYVIVQPGFDTWESVQSAQENLPSRQRTGGAWARSLKIIKADIRSFRGI